MRHKMPQLIPRVVHEMCCEGYSVTGSEDIAATEREMPSSSTPRSSPINYCGVNTYFNKANHLLRMKQMREQWQERVESSKAARSEGNDKLPSLPRTQV